MSAPVVTPDTLATLRLSDLQMFAALRIPIDLLVKAGVVRVTDLEARRDYGIVTDAYRDCSGLFFPYFCPVTGRRTTGRLRRDHPEIGADGKLEKKYLLPYGDNRHLYFPPGAREKLADPTMPIMLIEAEKSALALTAYADRTGTNLLPVAMGGCWSWLRTNHREEKSEPLPDLHYCDNRTVYICLDTNIEANFKVKAALSRLIRELQG